MTDLTFQGQDPEVITRDSGNAFQEQFGALREGLDHFRSESGGCLADRIQWDEIL